MTQQASWPDAQGPAIGRKAFDNQIRLCEEVQLQYIFEETGIHLEKIVAIRRRDMTSRSLWMFIPALLAADEIYLIKIERRRIVNGAVEVTQMLNDYPLNQTSVTKLGWLDLSDHIKKGVGLELDDILSLSIDITDIGAAPLLTYSLIRFQMD